MRRLNCVGIVCALLVCTGHPAPSFQFQLDEDAPSWIDAARRPTREAHEALALLRNAADEGLDPDDYRSAFLDKLAAALEAPELPSTEDVAAFDAALTEGMVRYLRHLHSGRVDPRAAGFRMPVAPDDHDFAAILRTALDGHRLTETVAEFTPPLAVYRGLRGMLARYRSLAADSSLEILPVFVATVRPGDSYAGLQVLQHRLVALSDLSADAPAPSEPLVYEGALVDGVKHFQIRHGLEPDGVLGKSTQAACARPSPRASGRSSWRSSCCAGFRTLAMSGSSPSTFR